MAATTVATAAGAVVLLYYVLNRRLSSREGVSGVDDDDDYSKRSAAKRRMSSRRRPVAQAPATWFETIMTLAETIRFTYSETLGKWPIGDLAFGINYFIRRQGNLQVASLYAGENSVQLKGIEIIAQLYHYLKLLTLCMLFSKKPFPVFLDTAGYSEADVLLQKPKAGLLKPAFTILHDKDAKCFLLLIRGTHSIKDTLTAATSAVVPFHHSVLNDGGISNLVLGYAHCGMVAAARWIAKLSTPILLRALHENPDHDVKIVGHSLGGGTAALLTYILREQKELSQITCIAFAPAACMTWELAESGKHLITTIINGSDLVPTFSTASVDDLRSEVRASSWLNDLRDQVEHNRVLNLIYRSATALGSRLPSVSNAKARVMVASALLRPVSSSTTVVMKHAQDVAQAVVRTRSSFSSWTCMGPRRRVVNTPSEECKADDSPVTQSLIIERSSVSSVSEAITRDSKVCSSSVSPHEETDEEGLTREDHHGIMAASTLEDITEGELWYELEKELQRRDDDDLDVQAQEEEEAAAAKEISEEQKVLADAVESHTPISTSDASENLQFYPPGRIMHIISAPWPSSSETSDDFGQDDRSAERVGIYETPRELYSKLRLSKTMINDHYMPMYKKMMELLIKELENEEEI